MQLVVLPQLSRTSGRALLAKRYTLRALVIRSLRYDSSRSVERVADAAALARSRSKSAAPRLQIWVAPVPPVTRRLVSSVVVHCSGLKARAVPVAVKATPGTASDGASSNRKPARCSKTG